MLSISLSMILPLFALTSYSYFLLPEINSISYALSSLSNLAFVKAAFEAFTPASERAMLFAFSRVTELSAGFVVLSVVFVFVFFFEIFSQYCAWYQIYFFIKRFHSYIFFWIM